MLPTSENVAGLVERITFHSEDSGFAVLRVKARGHRDLVTVTRECPISRISTRKAFRAQRSPW